MPEYFKVEKPFLDKLRQLDWIEIDQGFGVPKDPSNSFRKNLKEVVLPEVFNQSIRKINLTDDGKEWLTDKHIYIAIVNKMPIAIPQGIDEQSEFAILLNSMESITASEQTYPYNLQMV